MSRYLAVVYGPTGYPYPHGTYDTIAEARAALVGNTWGVCCARVEDTQDPERGDVSDEDDDAKAIEAAQGFAARLDHDRIRI